MLVVEKIVLAFAEISLLKEDVILVDFLTEDPLNVQRGIEMLESINKLTNGRPVALVYNVHDKYIYSTDNLRFMGSQLTTETHRYTARAVVTTNSAARIAVNHFINLHKPLIPTKLFNDLDEAVAWVEGK